MEKAEERGQRQSEGDPEDLHRRLDRCGERARHASGFLTFAIAGLSLLVAAGKQQLQLLLAAQKAPVVKRQQSDVSRPAR